jgi:hypothetical protein
MDPRKSELVMTHYERRIDEMHNDVTRLTDERDAAIKLARDAETTRGTYERALRDITTDRDEWRRRCEFVTTGRADADRLVADQLELIRALRDRIDTAEKERDELRQDLTDARDGWERAVEEVRRLDERLRAIEMAARGVLNDAMLQDPDWYAVPTKRIVALGSTLLAARVASLSDGQRSATSTSQTPDAVMLPELCCPVCEAHLDGGVVCDFCGHDTRESCTCIEGNDHAVATTAVVNCPACGEGDA